MSLELSRTKFLTASSALLAALFAAAAPAAAVSAPARTAVAGASNDGVVKVHGKQKLHKHHRKSAKKHGHHYGYKHHRRTRVVNAPFTYVEKGYGRRGVLVDAPFAFVHTERRGRYVRAPFVNLWIPR